MARQIAIEQRGRDIGTSAWSVARIMARFMLALRSIFDFL